MKRQGAFALEGGNERCLMERLETAILASGALDEMWAWFKRQEGGAA